MSAVWSRSCARASNTAWACASRRVAPGVGHLIGEDDPIGQARLLRLLAQREQLVDLGAQLVCGPARFAALRVGVKLGAVQADVAHLQHVGSLRQQRLHKQVFDFGRNICESGDRVMVGCKSPAGSGGEGLVRRLSIIRTLNTPCVPIDSSPAAVRRTVRPRVP